MADVTFGAKHLKFTPNGFVKNNFHQKRSCSKIYSELQGKGFVLLEYSEIVFFLHELCLHFLRLEKNSAGLGISQQSHLSSFSQIY